MVTRVEALDLLTSTRSVRRTLDLAAPVDLGDIRECLRIALQAPNGTNEQPWRWLVVTDEERRRELARLYREAHLSMTGGTMIADLLEGTSDFDRVMTSTEWLVEHLAEVPVHVIPCYQPYLPSFEGDTSSFQPATMYGSIFPAVWSFQLALHERGYGTCITTMHLHHEAEVRSLLGIPDTYVQGCLLPVGRLRPGTRFRPAPRKPVDEVVALDGWDGPSF
jgi:nitroreductase